MNKKFLNIFHYLLFYGSLVVCLFTIMGLLGNFLWVCEIVSHFRVQYLFILSFACLFFLIFKRYKYSLALFSFAIINFVFIVPDYFKEKDSLQAQADNRHAYKALLTNFHRHNYQYEKLAELIEKENPDFLMVMEIDTTWLEEMEVTLSQYQYQKFHIGYKHAFNLGLFSKYPPYSMNIKWWGDKGFPTVVSQLNLEGKNLQLIGSHPVSPDNPDSLFFRNQQLDIIANYASRSEHEVMFLADMNTTPWAPYFSVFLEKSGLKDSRKGFGIQPTWPTYFPLLFIPLDHCFVSDGIKIIDRRVGPDIGSDHLPIIIEFVFD